MGNRPEHIISNRDLPKSGGTTVGFFDLHRETRFYTLSVMPIL
jgi:hypothetical protein